MKDTDTITLVVITVPLLLHVLGLMLLTSSHFGDRICGLSQKIYLINLTVAELMTCVLGIVKRLYRAHFRWISLAQFTFYYMMYEALVYMSLERCMSVYLNIRFPLYWCDRSAMKLIILSWIFNASLSVTFLLSDTGVNTLEAILFPVFDVMFLAVAVPTYIYIYVKIKEKQREDKRIRPSINYTSQQMTETGDNNTAETTMKNSGTQDLQNNNNNNNMNIVSEYVATPKSTKKMNSIDIDKPGSQDIGPVSIESDQRKSASKSVNSKSDNESENKNNNGSEEAEVTNKKNRTIKFGNLCRKTTRNSFIAHRRKWRRQRGNSLTNKITSKNNKQFLSIFLLVITFVVFTILPDMVLLYQYIRNVSMEMSPLYILYFFSYTCDFFIYTFTVQPVRKTLKKFLKIK